MNVKWQFRVEGRTLDELMEKAVQELGSFVAPLPLPMLWVDSITIDVDTVLMGRNTQGDQFPVAYEAEAHTSFDTRKFS